MVGGGDYVLHAVLKMHSLELSETVVAVQKQVRRVAVFSLINCYVCVRCISLNNMSGVCYVANNAQ